MRWTFSKNNVYEWTKIFFNVEAFVVYRWYIYRYIFFYFLYICHGRYFNPCSWYLLINLGWLPLNYNFYLKNSLTIGLVADILLFLRRFKPLLNGTGATEISWLVPSRIQQLNTQIAWLHKFAQIGGTQSSTKRTPIFCQKKTQDTWNVLEWNLISEDVC